MTQADRILKKLKDYNGAWINGQYFNTTMMISQYHTRIHELQHRGHKIEGSSFTDKYGFKSYRLLTERKTAPPEFNRSPQTFNQDKELETLTQSPFI